MYCTEFETHSGTCVMPCIWIDENKQPHICEYLVIQKEDVTTLPEKEQVEVVPS